MPPTPICQGNALWGTLDLPLGLQGSRLRPAMHDELRDESRGDAPASPQSRLARFPWFTGGVRVERWDFESAAKRPAPRRPLCPLAATTICANIRADCH